MELRGHSVAHCGWLCPRGSGRQVTGGEGSHLNALGNDRPPQEVRQSCGLELELSFEAIVKQKTNYEYLHES